MRVVLQRVSRAEVRIDDRVSGRIDGGFVVLAAFRSDDTTASLRWMADKIVSLRLFPDESGSGADAGGKPSSFSRDIGAVEGGLLVVSQFTLYGDARRGRRPGFSDAAPPALAVALYDRFVALLRERAPGRVETGEFGAMMEVELVNDGPVTLILDSPTPS
ncbi:MAG TPA: D-aminoacyl-tRNA deacylase [Longimicrobiales bacterium]|nr:D-aminoacyl-tRNA deacylase [Longimicrobiales bacterium]